MTQRVRIGITAAMGSLLLLASACSSTPTAVSTDTPSTIASSSGTQKAKESVGTTTTTEEETTDSTTKSVRGTTTLPKKATTTTKPPKATDPEFALAAIEAFKAKVGEFKGLQLTVNFNSTSSRSELKAQDPAKPANVDAYEYTGDDVEGPTPVKVTGGGDLEANLFSATEVAWEKLPALFEQAKTEIGELEGSKGVTHFIVKRNLPFDDDVVINVYIDGGARTSGGYVSFKADGTLKKVFGPS